MTRKERVSVCVGETERQIDRETERQSDRETEKEKKVIERERERERENG